MAKVIFTSNEDFLALCAGAFTISTETKIPLLKKLLGFTGSLVLGENIIVVHNEVKALLTEEELAGLIAHEEGHHYYDHLGQIQAADENATGVFDNNTFELEADAWAASIVGKKVMISALTKVFNFVCLVSTLERVPQYKHFGRKTIVCVSKNIKQAIKDTGRIAALKAI